MDVHAGSEDGGRQGGATALRVCAVSDLSKYAGLKQDVK